jgi:antirestriction protein ArdC
MFFDRACNSQHLPEIQKRLPVETSFIALFFTQTFLHNKNHVMSTSETMKFDLYQTVTDRIIERLESGTMPWRKPWSSAGPPMNGISKRAYQGINNLLLIMLPFESNLYLTFEQLKKVGGSVNRGEHGHIVVFWEMP